MGLSRRNRLAMLVTYMLVIGVVLPSIISGQRDGEPIITGWSTSIRSEVMQEERPLQIHLPQGYETSADRYPVLILLDGPLDFNHVVGVTDFLAANYKALPMIVVGVSNTYRTRDLTPAARIQTALNNTDAGGADRFLKFIASELLPTIDQQYRTSPYRILVGRSHGGLFTLHAFIPRADLFDAYIAIDPSLWWDEASIFPRLISHLSEQGGLNRTLFIADATRDKQLLEYLDAFDNAEMWLGFRKKDQLASWLSANAPGDLRWAVRQYPSEDHGSVTHRAVHDGLEMIFSDMNKSVAELFELARNGGIEALDAYYISLSERYGILTCAPESVVNRLGYGFIQTDVGQAITLFKRNIERFPQSANAYDSLGDAYTANRQLELAFDSYSAAVRLAKKQRHPNRTVYYQKFEQLQDYLNAR